MVLGHMYFSYVIAAISVYTIFLSSTPVCSIVYNATVSLDGKGDFTTVGAAIAAAPSNLKFRFYIHINPGTYHESVQVPEDKTFIALVGDSPLTTIITDNKSNGTGFTTSNSATLTVKGDYFTAHSLSLENSAGPEKGQAVAVLDEAQHTSYYKCMFFGFQDTLYVNEPYKFFKECDVYGTVDFIFGDGLVLFQDCNIYARMPHQTITVTAQSKQSLQSGSGFSFQNCTVTVSPEITTSNRSDVHVYLGRPWREYSEVVFIESFMDSVVLPEGWSEWEGVPLNHLYYGEYNNRGPGSNITKRVRWSTYHVMDKQVALQFTLDNFINGSQWLPDTGVPFRLGLLS